MTSEPAHTEHTWQFYIHAGGDTVWHCSVCGQMRTRWQDERIAKLEQQLAQARAEIQRYDTTMAEATEELRQCKAVFERQAQWEAQARSLLERLHDAAEEPVDSDRVQDAYRALRAFLAAHLST